MGRGLSDTQKLILRLAYEKGVSDLDGFEGCRHPLVPGDVLAAMGHRRNRRGKFPDNWRVRQDRATVHRSIARLVDRGLLTVLARKSVTVISGAGIEYVESIGG